MLDWLYEWLWPSVGAAELFGTKPLIINSDTASLSLLKSGFPGTVKDLTEYADEDLKEELVSHTVEQMTSGGVPSRVLIIANEPELYAAQLHLKRLLEHLNIAQTWIVLVDAQRTCDLVIKSGYADGKQIH